MSGESEAEMKEKKVFSVMLILTAAAGWGLIGLFSRPLAASGLTALQITFVRSVIVLAGMGIFLLCRDRRLFLIHLRDLWMFFGTGLISIVFFNVCYFTTIRITTLAAASILLYTAPCFVMFMSAIFFKEKITAQKLAALVLAFAGSVLVSGLAEGGISPFGFLAGIGSGIGYATYSIFSKAALKKYHTFTLIFYTFAVASVCLLPFVGIREMTAVVTADARTVATALGLGLVSTFMPYICYTAGLKEVEAGKASVLAFAEPMVAAVTGIGVFHEKLRLRNAAGILLIFLAIVLLNIPLQKKSVFRERKV